MRNLPRAEARAAGHKTYTDGRDCPLCGCPEKYVTGGMCVDCTKAKAVARYAALDDAGRANHKQRDHDRYLRRLALSARDDE